MRNRLWALAAIVVLVIAVTVVLGQSRSRAKSASDDSSEYSDRWEYLVVSGGEVNLSPSGNPSLRKQDAGFAIEAFPVEQNLDKLGRDGWELVAVTMSPRGPLYYLKRRK